MPGKFKPISKRRPKSYRGGISGASPGKKKVAVSDYKKIKDGTLNEKITDLCKRRGISRSTLMKWVKEDIERHKEKE